MSTSSTVPGDGDEPFDPAEPVEIPHPFDVERFARETIQAIEFDDDIHHVQEERLLAIEEAVAARWPRRWLLWRRLRREIRATVATWPDDYIPRNDFRGRRSEWADQESMRLRDRRRRRLQPEETQTRGWERHTGWDPVEQPPEDGQPGDGTDPGAGFLP